MAFHFVFDAANFAGGLFVGAGSWALVKAKLVSDAKTLLADAKAEAAKVTPSFSTVISKIEAAVAKL